MKKRNAERGICMLPKKKFAMLLMDAGYCSKKDYAVLETDAVETHIMTVNTPEQAVALAKDLSQQGFGAIEVCGAFGEELARRMFEATGKQVSVGYVTCPQDEKQLSDHFWSQQ